MMIEFISLILLVFVLLPIFILGLECITACLPGEKETIKIETRQPRPKITVLVPAHNEESGIAQTLETILPQLAEKDRLVVIADNCNDQTATIASNLGATVIERKNLDNIGKGYALDYGLRFIEENPPEVIVIIDADCLVEENTIEKIARLAQAENKPVQATYLMETAKNPQPKQTISALAFMIKNQVRLTGLSRLGLPCLLAGSGMAIPWSIVEQVSLANENIVEDLQLTVDLAIKGYPTLFCSQAKVTGFLPQQEQGAKNQRTRWEHGYLQIWLTQIPRLIKIAVLSKKGELLALALDLSVLPLSLLVLIWLLVTLVSLLVALLGLSWIPGILLLLGGLMLLISIISAWSKFGREQIPGRALLAIPSYIIWKIPIYLGFVVKPEKQWVRTQRD